MLGSANIIQTIPSLALFGFLLPAPWIGERADRLAILALMLYALLPLIRNTYTGIRGVDPAVVEAGRGMGMTDRQLLLQVELPLALGVILAGVRVATVLCIGLATIAAAIGAGGLGEFIFRGLAMVNNRCDSGRRSTGRPACDFCRLEPGLAGATVESPMTRWIEEHLMRTDGWVARSFTPDFFWLRFFAQRSSGGRLQELYGAANSRRNYCAATGGEDAT